MRRSWIRQAGSQTAVLIDNPIHTIAGQNESQVRNPELTMG